MTEQRPPRTEKDSAIFEVTRRGKIFADGPKVWAVALVVATAAGTWYARGAVDPPSTVTLLGSKAAVTRPEFEADVKRLSEHEAWGLEQVSERNRILAAQEARLVRIETRVDQIYGLLAGRQASSGPPVGLPDAVIRSATSAELVAMATQARGGRP